MQQIPTQPDDRAASIIILDRDERRVATLGGRGAPVFEAIFRDAENEAISLTFRTKSDTEEAAHLKQRNFVAVEDPWEPSVFRLLEIVEVDQVSGDGEPELEVVCDDQALIELSGDYVDDIRLFGTTPDDALTRILGAAESRWKVGTVNLTGDGHTNIYHESVAEGLKKLSEAWGGIFRFRVTVDGARITGRYVDWFDPARWEDFTGVRWEKGKNLKSMKKSVISSDIATAIYPYGKGEELEGEERDPNLDPAYGRRISIEDVEWSVEKGDPVDKPKGQKWIGDPEALERWGYRNNGNGDLRHLFHVEVFEDEEEPANLIKLGWEKLQTLTQEWATYEAEIIDRSRDRQYAHESTKLGTAGILIDDSFNPPVEVKARVIGAEVDLNNKRNLKLTLGSFVPGVLDPVRRMERDLEKKVDQGAPITLLDTTVRNLKDRLRATVGYHYQSETMGDLWANGPYGDPETTSYLQIKGGMMAIADRWDPVAGEPDWRSFGTGSGFTADLITAGTLNAELINIESVSEEGERLVRLNDGFMNTYFDGTLTLRLGGYGMEIYDNDYRHPDPKYDIVGLFSLNWSSAPNDPPDVSSYRGVGVGTLKDHIRLSKIGWNDSKDGFDNIKTGFEVNFTGNYAWSGFNTTYFGDRRRGTQIDASPYKQPGESTATEPAVRLKADGDNYLFISMKKGVDSGGGTSYFTVYHFRGWVWSGSAWESKTIMEMFVGADGINVVLRVRNWSGGKAGWYYLSGEGNVPKDW